MRVPLLYKKAGSRHVWDRLRDMVCEYQFAVAVIIPAADLDRFIREYFATVVKRNNDFYLVRGDAIS